MYKRLALVATIGFGLTGPVFASHNEGREPYPTSKYEITPDVLSVALEKAILCDGDQQIDLPTFHDYYTQS